MEYGRIEVQEITEIINERKFIDWLLESNYMDNKNTMKILTQLARHCYWDLGYREVRTIKYLSEYMNKNYAYEGNFESMYRKIYRFAARRPICEVDGIWITQAELDAIIKLNDKVMERLAFVTLCYAKLGKLRNPHTTGRIYNAKYKDIFQQARIKCSVADRYLMLSELSDYGLLAMYKMPPTEKLEKMSEYERKKYEDRMLDFRVVFMDEESEKVIFVDDWRELGYYYRKYKGENIIKCEKCGKLARGNKNNTKKYCNCCAGTIIEYTPQFKQCRCMDCGKIFLIHYDERSRKRCDECAKIERKMHNKQMYLKRKEKIQPI